MKIKISSIFRFETLIVVAIFIAYTLPCINKSKLHITGWGLPGFYRGMTNLTNTIVFFAKKDSPFLAYVLYAVPVLGAIAILCLLFNKFRTANVFLLLASIFGFSVSIYMYIYLMSSSFLKLHNSGAGLHLLLFSSLIGIIYTLIYGLRVKPKKGMATATPLQNNETIS